MRTKTETSNAKACRSVASTPSGVPARNPAILKLSANRTEIRAR
jgi:hypothetical protein